MKTVAVFYKSQQKFKEAASFYRRALAVFEATLSPSHPKLVTSRENYETLLREMKPLQG